MHDCQEQVWTFYSTRGRHDLLWRQPDPKTGTFDPYHIMVSEIMLQQTQVSRVTPKYVQFLDLFPTVEVLAEAALADVLKVWSGLGYNRRAKFLWEAAKVVHDQYRDNFPQTVDELVKLPGIGKNTAGAIAAYAFDRPVVFIETNIRTVFIHHFFTDRDDVTDKELLPLLEQAIDDVAKQDIPGQTPRTWYWALMDYGSFLKQTVGNLNRQSKTYAKQSTFEGSKRQMRGQVLRLLGERARTEAELTSAIDDNRLVNVLADLCSEGIISRKDEHYHLG